MRVEGVSDLLRTLERMSQKASDRRVLAGVLHQGAEPIRAHASSLAARRAGAPDLADHITVSAGRGDDGSVVMLIGPSNEERSDQPGKTFADQARFLEYGTSDTPAQPFLRPAVDAEGQAVSGQMAQAVWDQIAEEAK